MSFIKQTVRGVLELDPGAPAVEFKGRSYSWGYLAGIVHGLDRVFEAAGVGPGATIGVLVRNSPNLYATILSIVSSDRCVVTINALLADQKLVEDVRRLRTSVIVAEGTDWERPGLLEVAREMGCMAVKLTGAPESPVQCIAGLERPTGENLRPAQPGVAVEMLTSGTTGPPKRIPLKLAGLDKSLISAMVYDRDRKPDAPPKLRSGVQLLTGPFVHIGGLWGLFTVATAGRHACLLEKFDVGEWHAAVKKYRPKVSGGPPTALRMILDANIPREDLSSLIALRTGAAPLDPAIEDEFLSRYGISVLQNYAATEFGDIAGWTLKDYRELRLSKRGSVGLIQPAVEARCVDPSTDAEVPFGTEGILEIRAAHIGDGRNWIRTTDRAKIDTDRFLWITGRADNAILRGGFKVHPDDVVKALEQHPAVLEACVVGIDERRLGQVPVAALVLRDGMRPPDSEELQQFLRARLLPYQVPAQFKFIAEMPRTPSMKPNQPAVRELFAP